MILSSKYRSLSVALLSVAIVTAQPTFAENNIKIRPIVQSNYDRINAAFVKQDIQAATALFTKDYISISPKGEQKNLAETREYYDNLFNRFKIKVTSNKTKIADVEFADRELNVGIEQNIEATIVGRNKLVINQTSRDIWLKTPQGWRLKQSKILTSQTTINGKTFAG